MPLPKAPKALGTVLSAAEMNKVSPQAKAIKTSVRSSMRRKKVETQRPEVSSPPPSALTSTKHSAAQPSDQTKKTPRRTTKKNVTAPTPIKKSRKPDTGETSIKKSKTTLSAAPRRGRASVPSNLPKLFVLDTNVLLHDPMSLFRFAEHDIFLPMTTLEELDNHKKGTSDVARNARTVSRQLDALLEASGSLIDGVALSALGNTDASGKLYFETVPMNAPLPDVFPTNKGDNQILSSVRGTQSLYPNRGVVLVSKDINMRIKGAALGIPAEDYFNDKVLDDTDMLYSGKQMLPANFWQAVSTTLKSWQENARTHYSFETDNADAFLPNMCLWIENDEDFMASVLKVEGRRVTIRLLKDYRDNGRFRVWGIHARNREQNMALNLLMDPDIDFVTLLGQAGTGKTLMTLAAALTQTLDERRFSEIIVTRATVSVGEDIGFLPGTEEEKMAPWMGALEDNLEVLNQSEGGDWGRSATLDLVRARIRIKSMSFMRGRTFMKKFLIIDEAQNLSPKQMKTLITRAGPDTKIVCLGNIAQIDTPYLTEGSSGLTYVVERFQGWEHSGHITLQRGERSRLADHASDIL